jgi:hypothetical protein
LSKTGKGPLFFSCCPFVRECRSEQRGIGFSENLSPSPVSLKPQLTEFSAVWAYNP